MEDESSTAATIGLIIGIIIVAILWAFVKINEGKVIGEGSSISYTTETEVQND